MCAAFLCLDYGRWNFDAGVYWIFAIAVMSSIGSLGTPNFLRLFFYVCSFFAGVVGIWALIEYSSKKDGEVKDRL
ncbi:MAG: hypothetical protein J6M18_05130 [Actinomycetaceae bacterium]|nr:hypothetical protein [Actinomycetaceae bacterium]